MENNLKTCSHVKLNESCSKCCLNETFRDSELEDIPKTELEIAFAPPEPELPIENCNTIPVNDPSCNTAEIIETDFVPTETDEPNTSTSQHVLVQNNDQEKTTIVIKPLIDPPSWTLRLIASSAFSVPMAIEYLHTIHDKPSLTHLGKRFFDLPQDEVDFFLPQLMFMYVNKIDAASVTHAYIEDRHNKNPQFTIICSWLLDCFIAASNITNPPNHALMLRSMLRSDTNENDKKLNSSHDIRMLSTLSLETLKENDWVASSAKKSASSNHLDKFGEISVGVEATEDMKVENKLTLARELSPKDLLICERKFIEKLVQIGRKLMIVHLADSKQEKMSALKLELQMLNVMLPAPVWVPFESNHLILKIIYNDCAVLNSKDKVPYIIFAEVLRSSPSFHMDIPHRRSTSYSNGPKRSLGSNKRINVYHDTSDPSAAVFAESWYDKKDRIRACSDYGGHEDWDLIPVIVKYGDDLSQESFAQQLLQIFKDLWSEEGVPLYVRPYKIVCVGPDAGLIEPVLDTLSLHQIKRHLTGIFRQNGNPANPTLRHHFEDMFGPPGSEAYVNAQKCFIQSAAAYSLVSYFLQLKDRHNGNILLDLEGHLIHIDYGFLLSSSPRNLGFETAPFKLTSELIDVMGGIDSDMFLYYKSLLLRGLMAARKHHRRIVSLAEIMSTGSKMQCFRGGPETVRALEARFHVSSTDEQLQQLVDTLVDGSRDSYTTRFYDSFQYYTNGIH